MQNSITIKYGKVLEWVIARSRGGTAVLDLLVMFSCWPDKHERPTNPKSQLVSIVAPGICGRENGDVL